MEGYDDPFIMGVRAKPIWEGGDFTNGPKLSINSPPTAIPNNPVIFFTGNEDHLFTRRYAQWYGKPYVNTYRNHYKTIWNEMEYLNEQPWVSPQLLYGTDGVQFHPDLQEGEQVNLYVDNLCRVGSFIYNGKDTDTYNFFSESLIIVMIILTKKS